MLREPDTRGTEAPDRAAAAPGETVQAHLRRVTRPWHDAVEDLFAPYDLATADGLGGFLLRQCAAVLPVERALEAAGVAGLVPDWAERRRSDALLADLRRLGLEAPHPLPVFAVPSAAHAMGSLYVLEGSKLGGRVLLRRVLAARDPRVRAASAYLGHHQPGGWARFTAVLNGGAAPLDGLRAGADAAFALFGAAARGDPNSKAFPPAAGSPLVHFTHA